MSRFIAFDFHTDGRIEKNHLSSRDTYEHFEGGFSANWLVGRVAAARGSNMWFLDVRLLDIEVSEAEEVLW